MSKELNLFYKGIDMIVEKNLIMAKNSEESTNAKELCIRVIDDILDMFDGKSKYNKNHIYEFYNHTKTKKINIREIIKNEFSPMIDYWASMKSEITFILDGFIFSLLTLIDGASSLNDFTTYCINDVTAGVELIPKTGEFHADKRK